MFEFSFPRQIALASMLLVPAISFAQGKVPVQVHDAWARVSVTGQQSTGAFMRLQAAEPLRLVGGSSPVAGEVEIHEMKLEGDVMRMRPVRELELPAGKPVELRPGGLHMMLQDLKAPLVAGSRVPLTLVFRDARGAEHKLDLQVPVSMRAPAPAGGARSGTDEPALKR
jgi:copper(I)-binding protein